jgi:DNA polymerase sigma
MKLLRRHNASRGYVETILHARVPIIKFLDGPTGTTATARQAQCVALSSERLQCGDTPLLPPAAGLPCDMSVSGAGAAFKCSVLRMLCKVRRLCPLAPLDL